MGLKFSDLQFVGLPGGKVQKQRQNPWDGKYSARVTEGRAKGKKPSSEYKLPIKTSQQYLKMGNKTLLEEIQQKAMVVKGDPLPMQSEHGWKATGDTLYDYVR